MGLLGFRNRPVSGPEIVDFGGLAVTAGIKPDPAARRTAPCGAEAVNKQEGYKHNSTFIGSTESHVEETLHEVGGHGLENIFLELAGGEGDAELGCT